MVSYQKESLRQLSYFRANREHRRVRILNTQIGHGIIVSDQSESLRQTIFNQLTSSDQSKRLRQKTFEALIMLWSWFCAKNLTCSKRSQSTKYHLLKPSSQHDAIGFDARIKFIKSRRAICNCHECRLLVTMETARHQRIESRNQTITDILNKRYTVIK